MQEYLFGKTLNELKAVASQEQLPSFVAKQLADWLYKKGVGHISEMSNLSLKVREQLSARYELGRWPVSKEEASTDGTKKYLYPLVTGELIEAVFIPDADRATLCVSSQAGCRMACRFCMTARQGFQTNLTAGEILNQVQSLPEYALLTNVVFMGMGEPMDNMEQVLKSLEIMTADYGYAWSPKRITVSTIGVTDGLKQFLDKSKCHLAVSLHNPFDDERRQLMPMQKAYPIADTIDLIRKYDFTHQRRVSFEYIMFDGVNDTIGHAKALVSMLNGLPCRMNLIRFHQIPDSPLRPSKEEAIDGFKNYLNAKGLLTTVRSSRGEDIFAACGMLSTMEKENKD